MSFAPSDIFDLISAEDDIRKTCGLGLLPNPVYNMLKKISLYGEASLNPESIAQLSEWMRASEAVVDPTSVETGKGAVEVLSITHTDDGCSASLQSEACHSGEEID